MFDVNENGEAVISEEKEKKRPVIKGYPELRWTGKRPFNGGTFYPAQLKETYGESKDGWLNKIFWGDNLQVMGHLLKEYRGKIDLREQTLTTELLEIPVNQKKDVEV